MLTVYNKKVKLTFENVAFGELYLATGQSNMQWTVSQCEIYADEYINAENYNKDIHLLRLTNTYAEDPLDELTPSSLSGVWSEAGKISIQLFSAVGYFFAKELNAQYNVPVGVIMTCAGGTMTGSWMYDEAYAQADKTYNVDDPSADTYHLQGGTLRYNAMIHPLRKFTVRGALWYQGENQPIEYEKNLKLLIDCWRRVFENDKFYSAIVQLPRYENPSNNGNENYFLVREQQKNAALSTEYSTYSCNIDLGMLPYEAEGKPSNTSGIHPFDKKPVGERLAHAVMQDLYGAKGGYRGPELDTLYVDNGEVYVTLKNCGTGLEILYFGAGFEVAGADGIYYDAVPSLLDEERRTKN